MVKVHVASKSQLDDVVAKNLEAILSSITEPIADGELTLALVEELRTRWSEELWNQALNEDTSLRLVCSSSRWNAKPRSEGALVMPRPAVLLQILEFLEVRIATGVCLRLEVSK